MADKANKIDPKLVDELLKGQEPQKVLSSEGLLGDLKKALAVTVPQKVNHLQRCSCPQYGQRQPRINRQKVRRRRSGQGRNRTSQRSTLALGIAPAKFGVGKP